MILISSFSSSLSFFLPPTVIFFRAEFSVVPVFCFLKAGSELVFPRVEEASLFFFGVVISCSVEELLSLSVA